MLSFILEIGTEELPARFLPGLEAELKERFATALDKEGVECKDLAVMSTPRRAVVRAALAERSVEREELVMGPPVKVAYDAQGKLTKAADGFARTQSLSPDALFTEKTEKGEYLAGRKKMGGKATLDILAGICPEIITGLSFPKRMHWGADSFTYARPLRWIVALLGAEVVPFSVGLVKSGNQTWGHRIHGYGPFAVPRAEVYAELVAERCRVTVDGAVREEVIVKGGNALAQALGGRVIWKDGLLLEVSGLTEHPVPLLGGFDPSFLEIPREVLLTSMENHQKSFGLEDSQGKLLPHFLTVLNMTPGGPDGEALVRKGWERVLRARLEDARFFWKADLAASLESWLASLDKVIFLAPLGSMGDKTRRISRLAGWLAERLGADVTAARRAGRLSKADLVSEMVKEFDTLQGIMGGIYARRKGEPENVATALSEQYLPAGPDAPLPATLCGALLSMADKADTLAGCFGLGMIPTGAADPYALRRCALGIARILEEKKLRLDVDALFAEAFSAYGERDWKIPPAEALPKLREFFTVRLKNYFTGHGRETLLVEAALGAESPQGLDVWASSARLSALEEFSRTADFWASVLTFKRAANIIRKQGQEKGAPALAGDYKKELLQEDAEQSLAAILEALLPRFEALWSQERFGDLFALLRELRPAVDAFFEGVMVMCEDKELQRNRLNLLSALVKPLGRLADFGALQI